MCRRVIETWLSRAAVPRTATQNLPKILTLRRAWPRPFPRSDRNPTFQLCNGLLYRDDLPSDA